MDSNRRRSASPGHKRDYDEDHGDYDQYMSNPGCFSSDTTGTECFGDQSNDQKDDRVSEHDNMKPMFSTGNRKHKIIPRKFILKSTRERASDAHVSRPVFRSPRDSVGRQQRSIMWKRGFRKLLASWAPSNTHAECKM